MLQDPLELVTLRTVELILYTYIVLRNVESHAVLLRLLCYPNRALMAVAFKRMDTSICAVCPVGQSFY